MNKMTELKTMTINGVSVTFDNERNVLEVCRNSGIEIPTFCYHSDLSVYGACRLCLVDIEGRGIQASCSIVPEPGMVIKTHTGEIRKMRQVSVELLLASHPQECTTCAKSKSCQLQSLARKLGVKDVRFKSTVRELPLDTSSPSLIRDPNKCILCGDCVRACDEIQGIGAIDFAHRGSESTVTTAFDKPIGEGECVNCGQCAAVCPVGAIIPATNIEDVWKDLADETKTVVVQIAPAVRVALGEEFGMQAGELVTGQTVAALRALGFDQVYDTCFAADLTVIEEANEFIDRFTKGQSLPQFTSCCPAWVKYTEQYHPELLNNLSSCRSPQQMFGAMARKVLPGQLGKDNKDIVVVSIMPCTAKKFEAGRDEFAANNIKDVDHVLTTQELGQMIEEAGLDFANLKPQALDMPLGFKTGAGVIFGTTGGVAEAVLRYAAEKVGGITDDVTFEEVRGEEGLREAFITLGDKTIRMAIVHGLANAAKLAQQADKGESPYDIIEVMACPMGCVGGAGQPVTSANALKAKRARAQGLHHADRTMQLHRSQDNHLVDECYKKYLGEIGGPMAHKLLHTHYKSRRRMADEGISLSPSSDTNRLNVTVCVGTSCFLRGSQDVLKKLLDHAEQNDLNDKIDIRASFCFEKCDRGPMVTVDGESYEKCSFEQACKSINAALASRKVPA